MKKTAAWVMVLCAIGFVGMLPSVILGKVERYQVVAPQRMTYRPSVKCSGTVYSREAYDILVSGLYQVEEAYAKLGEPVKKGQTVARLKPAEGEKVLYLQTQGQAGVQESGMDPLALAKSYGVDVSSLGQLERYSALQSLVDGEGEEPLEVHSPISGIITREIPAEGSVIKSGGVLCSVEGNSNYYAMLTVSEKDAGKITPGSQVTLSGEGTGLAICQGTVTKVCPGTRKELSGTSYQTVVDVEVALDAGGAKISPGFSVKAQIFTDAEKQLVVLPYESVRQDQNNQEYVLVAKNHFLEKRPITTGLELADGVEVLDGVNEDELITVIGSLSEPSGDRLYLLEGK